MGVAIALAACPKPRAATSPPAAAVVAATKLKLAVLAVESDRFPQAAKAATEALAKAQVAGIDETQVSQVSLEVVQLSIECVEETVACYEAVAKSLSANRLLFARIVPGKRRDVRVTITLFDVDSGAPRTAEKLFASEREAVAAVDALVAEVTQP